MADIRILRHLPTKQEVYNKEFVDKIIGEEVIQEPEVGGVPMARVVDPITDEGRWEEVITDELVRSNLWFDTPQARDAYFNTNPLELIDGVRVAIKVDPPTDPVTYYIEKYDELNARWDAQIALGRGPKGEDGINGVDGIPGEPEADGEVYGRVRQDGNSMGSWQKVIKYIVQINGLSSFPHPGDPSALYIDTAEENLYRFDETEEDYVMVSAESEPNLYFGEKDSFPVVGNETHLYLDLGTNLLYHWDGDTQEYHSIEVEADADSIRSKESVSILKLDDENLLIVDPADAVSSNNNNAIVVGTDDKLFVESIQEVVTDELQNFPGFGKTNTVYVDTVGNVCYRWDTDVEEYVKVTDAFVIPHDDFPQEGVEGKLYVDTTGHISYVWNATEGRFETIGVRVDAEDEQNIAHIEDGLLSVYPADAVSEEAGNMIQIVEGRMYVSEGNINVENIVDTETPDNAVEVIENKLYVEDLTQTLLQFNSDDVQDPQVTSGNIVAVKLGQTTWNEEKLEKRIQPIETGVSGLDTRLTSAEGSISNTASGLATLSGTVTAQGNDIAAIKTIVPELERVPFDPYDLQSDENPTPAIQDMSFWDAPFFAELNPSTNPDVWVRYWNTAHTDIRGWYWWKNDGSGTQGWNFLAVEDSETGKIRSRNLKLQIPTTDAMESTVDSKIASHNLNTSSTVHPEIRAMVNSAALLPTLNGSLLNFATPAGGTLQIDLAANSAFKSVTYDEPTQQLIFVMSDDSVVSVPMGSLIPIFNGSTGDNIQITVDNQTNEIGAVLLEGTIVKAQLHPDLQEALESVPSTANFVTINSEQTIRASKVFSPTNTETPGIRVGYIAPPNDIGDIKIGTQAASSIDVEGLHFGVAVPSGDVNVQAWRVNIESTDPIEPLKIGGTGTTDVLIQATADSDSSITIDSPTISFNGGRITNIAAPTDLGDVTTMGFCDANYIRRGESYPLLVEASDSNTARSLSALNPSNIYYVR